ncbi:hypothetical protein V6N12_050504 [Hibiscus sabdariffa]|uniref:Uncharacterized protein n=1 Tax=Hibiscus sabdariffa TaxID=183260 RepID=A0ABR2GCK6_9ROSI
MRASGSVPRKQPEASGRHENQQRLRDLINLETNYKQKRERFLIKRKKPENLQHQLQLHHFTWDCLKDEQET